MIRSFKWAALLCLGLILLVSPMAIAGEYDGIWTNAFNNSFLSVRHGGGLIAVITFDLSDKSKATTFWGSIVGNKAVVGNLNYQPQINVSLELDFTSASTGFLIMRSCSGDCGEDNPPPGTPFSMQKIF